MKRPRLKPGDKVQVCYWNNNTRQREWMDAVLDYYSYVASCWYMKKPCDIVWAYREDIRKC